MWRVYRDAGRPWPVVCDDDVIDYMVMEAISIKVRQEDAKKAKEAEEKALIQHKRQESIKKLNEFR